MKKKKKLGVGGTIAIILVVVVTAVLVMVIVGNPESTTANTSGNELRAGGVSEPAEAPNPTPSALEIVDNSYATATFEGLTDGETLGVAGGFYAKISVVNSSDCDLWVYIENASVNDEMVPIVASGVPFHVNTGKSGRCQFWFPYNSLSIDNVDSVDSIEFDLVIADKGTLSEITREAGIRLTF